MLRSLFSGVSGLKNHQTRMDVIGNNISNVNTTGFKSSRVTFSDTLSQTMTGAAAATEGKGGTNPKQIGLGSQVSSVDLLFTDGSVQSTGKNTDLCLSGSGLFVVKNSSGTYYTRNGAFSFDEKGNYVTSDGSFVQGWTAVDGSLDTNGTPSAIKIPAGKSMASKASQLTTYVNNLNSAAPTIESITYTKADGTSGKAGSSDEPTIKLTLEDGTVVTKLSSEYTKDYALGDVYAESLGSYPITSVTASAATDVTYSIKTSYTSADGFSAIAGTAGTTYKIGDTFSEEKTIDTAELDADKGTVKLTFDDGTSVTVPKPEAGSYSKGDKFTVTGIIDGISAKAGAKVSLDGYGDYTLVGTDEAKATATGGKFDVPYTGGSTVKTITREATTSSDTIDVDGDTIKSATLTMSDGTKQTVTDGKYTIGNSMPISTTFTVYDTLGNAHAVPINIEKTAANTWMMSLSSTTVKESDGSTSHWSLLGDAIYFTPDGEYDSSKSANATLSFTSDNGADPQTIVIDRSNLTQYSGSSTINASADGNAAGTLSSISVDSSGIISGTYTNGIVQAEAQVAVAQFNNSAGLTKVGGSYYQESNNSGVPNVKTAEKLGVSITPSALEMSNVDIADQFSDMIITQRGFQSNSKIITVSDEILETLINMKR